MSDDSLLSQLYRFRYSFDMAGSMKYWEVALRFGTGRATGDHAKGVADED